MRKKLKVEPGKRKTIEKQDKNMIETNKRRKRKQHLEIEAIFSTC